MPRTDTSTSPACIAGDDPAARREPPERGRARFDEETLIRRFMRSMNLGPGHVVLDIGCGHGRTLEWLRQEGLSAHGVDINPANIAAVRARGFEAMTVAEFNEGGRIYDAMVMSHIIEHFAPADLLQFVDGYLDRLKAGGFVLIATPLPWEGFLEDFDHIRAYPPHALKTVLTWRKSAVQYHSKHQLVMLDYGLRRQPIGPPPWEVLYAEFYRPGPLWRLRYFSIHRIARLLFAMSGGILGGRTTGWIGLFQKVE